MADPVLMEPYGQKNFMGLHAGDAACLAWIRVQKWDSTKDGLGTPNHGMWYVDTGSWGTRFYLDGAWTPPGGVDADLLNRQMGPNLSGDPSTDFVISDGGSGTIDISGGTVFIRESSALVDELVRLVYAGETGVTLPVNPGENWVYLDYNAGTPQAGAVASVASVNLQSQIVIGRVYRVGTAVYIWNVGQKFQNYNTVGCFKDFEVHGAQRASGLVAGETGTRNLTVTQGVFYCAHNRTETSAIDTSGLDTFEVWNSAASTSPDVTGATQVDNLKRWNGTALVDLGNNRYGSRFLYVDFAGNLHAQVGTSNSVTAAGAAGDPVPTPPVYLRDFSLYIGRVVIKKSASVFASISNPWIIAETGSIVTEHADLGGLSDDDHTQYALISSQAGAPSTVPSRVGLINVDTSVPYVYISGGTSSSEDWVKVS